MRAWPDRGAVLLANSLIVFALAWTSSAADPEFFGRVALLAEPEVAVRLDLTEQQQEKILSIIDEREQDALELALKLKDLPAAEREQSLAAFRAESERKGAALLTDPQRRLLDALWLDRAGMTSLADPAVADKLGLTPEQRARVESLLQDRIKALAGANQQRSRVVRIEYERKLAGLLSREQRALWDAMVRGESGLGAGDGPAASSDATDDSALASPQSGAAAGPAPPAENESQTSNHSESGSEPQAASKLPSASGNQDGQQPADAADANDAVQPPQPSEGDAPQVPLPPAPDESAGEKNGAASQPGAAADQADRPAATPAADDPSSELPPEAESETQTNGTPPMAGDDVKLRFNFRFQPWGEVLQWFADQADLSLIMDAPPTGTFNYTDSRTYTPAQAIDLLNGVLLTKGYTLIRRDRLLMVINLEDGIPPNLVPTVPVEELDRKGEFELVSTLFTLRILSPDEAETEISRMLGPQGSIVKFSKARQILVTETAGRLRTIRSVIQRIENPEGEAEFRVFQLQAAPVDTVAAVVRQLLDIPSDSNSTRDGSLRLAVDTTGNKLLVRGRADLVARVAEILDVVDAPGHAEAGGGVAESPQLEVYSITSADPQSVLQVMQTLLAGLPDVRLAIDPKTGNLIALARPSQHGTIRATLEQMQRDARQVEVIRLSRVDPQLAVLAINKLFGAESEEGKQSAPKVDAEPNSRQLLIRGSQAQIAQIRGLLEKMGEAAPQELAAQEEQKVRMLPYSGRAALRALEQLESIWPTVRKNKIRVVTPSAVLPTLQEYRNGGGEPAEQEAEPEMPVEEEQEGAADAEEAPQAARAAASRQLDAGWGVAGGTDRLEAAVGSAPARFALLDVGGGRQTGGPSPPEAVGELPPIIVAPGQGGVMIASDDVEALNDFEALLSALAGTSMAGGAEYTVFYLKSANATVVAETLGQILGGSSGGGGGRTSGGSLMGDIASAAFGDAGGILGSLFGGGGGGEDESSVVVAGSTLIVPDLRLNALIVKAPPAQLDTIEQLLQILDQEDPPEANVVRRPRLIPVQHSRAADMAEVLRQVYQDRLVTAAGQRQPSPEEFFRMLRGGRGGRQSGRDQAAETERMSIGVDERTNSLVIAAPQALFQEVEQLVLTLDQATEETNQAVRVVTLKRTNSQMVQQALAAITGDSVRSAGSTSSSSGSGRFGQAGTQDFDSLRNRMNFFNSLQQGQGGGFRGFGPGGGFPQGGGFMPGGGFTPGGGFQGGQGRSGGGRRGR